MPAQDVGTGTTIAFATSSFSADVLNIGGDGISREAIDKTHLGTTTAREFMVGKLYDPGSLELEIAFDPDGNVPYDQVEETITITFPLPSGKTTPANFAATGFITSFSYGAPLEDKMTASITIKLTGAITETVSA